MTNPDEYQGWTNRETWCVGLWLNNDQEIQEHARAVCKSDGEMLPEAARSLEDFVDDLLEQQGTNNRGGPAGFVLDLINCTLARVNWVELAQSFRED